MRFTPDVLRAGTYKVYTYVPKVPGLSSSTQITVFDGKKEQKVPYTAASVRVEGQTSGEWVELGSYAFGKGNKAYVEISNAGADGAIVADAVLFIPVEK